jgi:hypothetical protein
MARLIVLIGVLIVKCLNWLSDVNLEGKLNTYFDSAV